MSDYIGGPSTQFRPKVIPDGWDWVLLPTVCRLESGHTPDRKRPEYWNGTIKWVSLQDTIRLDDNLIATTAESITEQGIANSSARVLPAGTVIFSRTATVGKATILASEMATSQDFVNWICGERVHNAYLMQVLRGMERTWQSIMAGSTHNTIYMSDFKRLCILLPPINEQKVIASIIAYWDRGIRQLSDLIALKQRFKQGLMQQLLTGRRRFRQFSSEWKHRVLGSFLTESRILGSNGASANKLTVRLYGKGVCARADGRPGSEATQFYRRQAGQFIYSKLDFLNGAFGIVPEELDGYESSLDLPAFNVDESIDSRWLLYFVTRPGFYRNQVGLAHGGRKARRVNPTHLLQVSIPVPEKREQVRIAVAIETLDKEINLLNAELNAVKQQKKGLMQKLLTGQVRVKVRQS